MPEMHVRQPRFSHSPCRTFTKNKVRVQERIQKYKGTRDSIYIYIYKYIYIYIYIYILERIR